MEKYTVLIKNIETLLQEVKEDYELKKQELAQAIADLQTLKDERIALDTLQNELNEQTKRIEEEKAIDHNRKIILENKEKELQERLESIQNLLRK